MRLQFTESKTLWKSPLLQRALQEELSGVRLSLTPTVFEENAKDYKQSLDEQGIIPWDINIQGNRDQIRKFASSLCYSIMESLIGEGTKAFKFISDEFSESIDLFLTLKYYLSNSSGYVDWKGEQGYDRMMGTMANYKISREGIEDPDTLELMEKAEKDVICCHREMVFD